MTFAAPGLLWGFLVLPLIVLLYMLRTPRQDVPVSSLLLWRRAAAKMAAQRPARRFERSLLLLLQLLAAALLVLALGRPQLRLPGRTGVGTVIIVDTSASMQATDEAPSRFAVARSRAADVLEAAEGPVMVVEAASAPRIIAPFGGPTPARRALDALRPNDGPARVDQAVTLALGQRSPGGLRVEVFTDRAGEALPGVTYHMVGSGSRNLGIASVTVEPTTGGSALIVQVQNGDTHAQRVPVVITQAGRRLAARTITVGPGALASVAIPVTVAGVVRVELAVSDLVAVDNLAHAVTAPPPPRVIVAGAPDRALTEALAAIPVRFAPAQRITPEALASADVVILNRTPPVELPPGNYFLFATIAPNLPLEVEGRVRSPQVLRSSSRHPVMRYVALDDVTIGEALRLVAHGGEVLAEAETPLLWAYEGAGVRAVVSAFALDQSDLPLRVAFPILLQNALTWLGGAERLYQAGAPIILPAGSLTKAELQLPNGARTPLVARAGRFVIPSADRTGLYVVRAGGREQVLVVNPSPEEIAIAPVQAAPDATVSSSTLGRGRSDIWPVLLVLALLALCVEWWVWLRALPRASRRRSGTFVLRTERPS